MKRKPKTEQASSFTPDSATLAQLRQDSTKRKQYIKEISRSTGLDDDMIDSREELRQGYDQIDSSRRKLAFLYKVATTREDSLMIEKLEVKIELTEMNLQMAERRLEYKEDQLKQQRRINRLYLGLVIAALLFAGALFWLYRERVKTNRELQEKNTTIEKAMNYAQVIQSSFLLTKEEMKTMLPQLALYYRPMYQISGDMYWARKVNGKILLAAIDCTGHGIPGAFISMLVNTLLNEIVVKQGLTEPARILEELHYLVVDNLQQAAGSGQAQDGMDMSLLVIDKDKRQLRFAGAKNHLYVADRNQLDIIRADVNSIGGKSMRSADGFKKSFTTKEVPYDESKTYFLYTDGFPDQFGGERDKKFNLKNFRELLQNCARLPMENQEKFMRQAFEKWKGDRDQIDDVTVISMRLV